MEKIIIQLLSCLYLYDSDIQVPVCIRQQSRSTDYRPVASVNRLLALAFTYRAVGQQTSGTVGKFAQSQLTGFWRPKG